MEALYEAYVGVYQPDTVPPYKMEVTLNRQCATIRLAGTLGIHGLSDGSNGQLTGGFFVPSTCPGGLQ